jgi:alanyl-tRNA synthetase
MTDRLYYTDMSLLEFEASIVAGGQTDAGYFTILDKTAFYPTSGGQLHDTGTLNGIAIFDVIEDDAGDVRHITNTPVGDVGDIVHGRIDKDRRRRHRQLHTAQHILSQVFIRLFNAQTVSVHLGEDYGAVELDASQVSAEQSARAEQTANEIIQENHPVEGLLVSSDQAATLPLRKVPTRQGTIRVIRIDDFDWSACGGTHCTSTAEVGMLKIVGLEKMRGRPLIKFLAGAQAFEDYCKRLTITDELSRRFTCHVNGLIEKVNKLVAENEAKRKEIALLQKELSPVWVDRLAAEAETCGRHQLVCQKVELFDGRSAGQIASLVAERTGGITVLVAGDLLIVAVASGSGLHAGRIAKQLCELTGLKGGGSAGLAQIGGVNENQSSNLKVTIEKLLSGG